MAGVTAAEAAPAEEQPTPGAGHRARHRREPWWRPFADALRPTPFAVVALITFVLCIYVGQSVRTNTPDHGDWWTDMTAVEGAQRISRFGYWTTRLAIPLDDGFALGTPARLYANWPSAPFELQAMAYDAGLEPRQVRIFPLLQTAAAGYALFCLARLVAGRATARFALVLFLTAAPVRLLADSFGYVPIDLFGRAAAFLAVALTATLDPRRQRAAWLAGVGATAALIAANAVLFGFESFPATCIFAAGYPLIRARWRGGAPRPALVAAVAAPALGIAGAVAGRLLLIAALPGSLGDDLAAVRSAAAVRFDEQGFANTFWQEWSHRVWEYVPILLVLALAGVALAVARAVLERRHLRLLAAGALVLVAESAWLLVAREHSHRHVHTIALLTYSLVLPAAWCCERATAALRRTVSGRVAVVAVATVGAWWILQDPGLQAYGNVATTMDWSAQEAEIDQIRAVLPPEAFVGISSSVINNGPVLEYLLDQPVMRLPNTALDQLAAGRPFVYIFRRDFPDDASAAALAGGATVVGETPTYVLLTFPSTGAIPPALDPDG